MAHEGLHDGAWRKLFRRLLKDIRALQGYGEEGWNSTAGLKVARARREARGWGKRRGGKRKRLARGSFLLDEARPIISGCLCDTRMVDINIHRAAKSRFNIHTPGKGTAVLRSLRLGRPGRRSRSTKKEIEQRGENRDAALFASNRVERRWCLVH